MKKFRELFEAKMEDSEVLQVAKKLAKNGKNDKTKKFGQGLVDFYNKNKSFTPDQVSGLQNIMKNASFNLAETFEMPVDIYADLLELIEYLDTQGIDTKNLKKIQKMLFKEFVKIEKIINVNP